MADTLPTAILDDLEKLIEEKFDDLVKLHKTSPAAEASDMQQFEEQEMTAYDGEEVIKQDFFRQFLDFLKTYYNYNITYDQIAVLEAARYLTPVDYSPAPDCGKLIIPFANLVLVGTGVQPTIPNPSTASPNDPQFDQSSDLMIGGWAYNKTDNKWFYRGSAAIYELKECLNLGISDISGLSDALAAKVAKQAGQGLSDNNLTDALKTAYDQAYAHSQEVDIHLPPDGVTIEDNSGKLSVIASAIIALFSADLPISIDENGKFTLAIDSDVLQIVDGKLSIKPQSTPLATKLTYNPTTHILAVDPGGAASVDLSTLGGGGAADLSNLVKKTGETSQTIQGNLDITGETESFE